MIEFSKYLAIIFTTEKNYAIFFQILYTNLFTNIMWKFINFL